MKTLLTFTLSLWLALSVAANPLILLSGSPPAAAGGPDAWYGANEALTADGESYVNTSLVVDPVTVVVGGTATKLRAFINTYFGAGTLKMALYSSGGVLLGSGTAAVGAGGYVEVTMSAPVVIAAGTYKVATMGDSVNINIRYATIADACEFVAYDTADFPPANLPAMSLIPRSHAAGVFVD